MEIVAKLRDVEKRHEFYARLYRQYVTDLLKLCVYVRRLTTNAKLRSYLAGKFPEARARFEKIPFETQDE